MGDPRVTYECSGSYHAGTCFPALGSPVTEYSGPPPRIRPPEIMQCGREWDESFHGNTAGSQPAWLYALYSDTGEFLKWGVSQDPFHRYPADFMKGKTVDQIERGPRWLILQRERQLIESNPGPLNRDRWLGR